MKHLKMLGLAAVAALAVMAMIGAGTASAAALYGPGHVKLGAGTTIHGELTGTAVLETNEATPTILDECKKGTISGKTANAGGAGVAVTGAVAKENLTWTECTRTTHTIAGGELLIHHSSGSNGTLTGKGFEVKVNTLFGDCVFGFGTTARHIGTLVHGTPSTIAINTLVPRISGLCPAEVRWTANYKVTNPTTLAVTAS